MLPNHAVAYEVHMLAKAREWKGKRKEEGEEALEESRGKAISRI